MTRYRVYLQLTRSAWRRSFLCGMFWIRGWLVWETGKIFRSLRQDSIDTKKWVEIAIMTYKDLIYSSSIEMLWLMTGRVGRKLRINGARCGDYLPKWLDTSKLYNERNYHCLKCNAQSDRVGKRPKRPQVIIRTKVISQRSIVNRENKVIAVKC